MQVSVFEGLLVRLGQFQNRRPLLVVLLVLATLFPTGFLAAHLTLRSAFSELLPDNKRSVIEMRHISERLTSSSTLSVLAQSENVDALKHFVDALSPEIRKLDPKLVTSVDDGTRDVQEFFRAHKHLYADLADIQKMHDDVVDRYDYEVQKKSGMNLGLDDEDKGNIPPPLDAQAVEDKFKQKIDDAEKKQPGTDGYYIGKSRGKTWGTVLVRTPLGGMDPRAFELREQIEGLIAKIHPQQWDPALTVGFTGNLITGAEGHRAITHDLTQVGAWGVAMILMVVFLFFLRLRVLFCMGLTILVGCTWAFAGAYLSIGYLNTASGFLVSIIAGNGINFGIIYMARYIEARRGGETVHEAVLTAHRETRTATLAAAAAAMVAYGSLAVTNFRGFKHFGVIGGIGMLLCWIVTYLLLPPTLVLTERVSPLFHANPKSRWRSRARGFYGYPFVWLAQRAPRAIALFGLVSGVVTIGIAARYFILDPMEYNLRPVLKTNAPNQQSSASQLSGHVDDIVGRAGQDGRAIVVDRVDQVEPLVTELLKRRDAAPPQLKPFDKVVTIFELLPKDQPKKVELLSEIRDRVERGHKRGFVSEKDYAKINEYIPATITPINMADLPEGIARPFIDHEGQRGRIVYIVPTAGQSVYDAHYLQRWADAFRETRLPNGDVIYGSGDPVIFADVLESIRNDAPKAIFLSFVGTLGVIFLAFRGRRSGLLALSVLVVGLSWLVAFLSFRGIKLNFLNFVALPISVGVGADYALNIMKRRELTDDAGLTKGLIETGGAVVLCSLTTTLGYVALMFSMNGATQSFGLAAAAGEITTVLAAVLFLPAILFWLMKRKPARI
ncbi:MAG TPA: MMPL family transporter [Polyangiaceae bacterium]|jgi:predicted RND superfamily exporter protein|nr:MMPL family transporter [Polyangiaceae bacterium]